MTPPVLITAAPCAISASFTATYLSLSNSMEISGTLPGQTVDRVAGDENQASVEAVACIPSNGPEKKGEGNEDGGGSGIGIPEGPIGAWRRRLTAAQDEHGEIREQIF